MNNQETKTMLENPIVLEDTFKERGFQKVEVWKDKSLGAYYAIAENSPPPEKCTFVGMTMLHVH